MSVSVCVCGALWYTTSGMYSSFTPSVSGIGSWISIGLKLALYPELYFFSVNLCSQKWFDVIFWGGVYIGWVIFTQMSGGSANAISHLTKRCCVLRTQIHIVLHPALPVEVSLPSVACCHGAQGHYDQFTCQVHPECHERLEEEQHSVWHHLESGEHRLSRPPHCAGCL